MNEVLDQQALDIKLNLLKKLKELYKAGYIKSEDLSFIISVFEKRCAEGDCPIEVEQSALHAMDDLLKPWGNIELVLNHKLKYSHKSKPKSCKYEIPFKEDDIYME